MKSRHNTKESEQRLKEDTLRDRVRDYGFAGFVYLGARAIDSLVTAYANKTGIGHEVNPPVKYLIDTLGAGEAALASGVAEVCITLPLTYRSRNVLILSSESFLYAAAGAHILVSAIMIPWIVKDYYF